MIASVLLVAPVLAGAAPPSQNQQYQEQHAVRPQSPRHGKQRQHAATTHAKSVNGTGAGHSKVMRQSANAKHARAAQRAAAHSHPAKKRKAV
jgi:hypothetical protein